MELLVPGARSLKDKRRVIKSLKQMLHNRFNCSVAEIGHKDLWGRATLAVCVVGDESPFVNTQLDEIIRFAGRNHDAELLDFSLELL